jgi:hypothetical protein
MITAPFVFVIGWIIGEVHAGQAVASVLLVIYGVLQIISNFSIPPYIEDHSGADS